MSKCPVCGRRTVLALAGYAVPCGRRVTWSGAPAVLYPAEEQWPERMALVDKCRGAAPENKDAA
jgi:hypothetical protein